ncbi:MAG TPA: exopolyphosphatase, partial [Gammaproteobacteria bacterium]|nr:exopolyphosphatase [Gammaproteobacteria bacterium]
MSLNSIESVAAVDLGSNSFHMIVAQVSERRLQVIDRLKEMVRLAAGLDQHNVLSKAIMDRAIECLRRFGQRLRGIPEDKVRAVGTNTLRRARNRAEFLARAEEALGHDIEIIAGREEARLIYLGVSHSLEDGCERRLVIDIGGGSTELILGQQFKPEYMDSLYIGCVGLSSRFFSDGRIDAGRLQAAEIAALQEFESVEA